MSNKPAETSAKKPSKVGDIIVGLIFLAGFVFLAFLPKLLNGPDSSFYTEIVSLFKAIKGIGSFGYLEFSYLAIAVFYVVALILTVLSFFFSKKTARALNYVKAVLGFAIFVNLLVAYYIPAKGSFNTGFLQMLFDLNNALYSIGFSIALSVLYLIILNLMQYKKAGLVKLLLFVLAFGFICFYNFTFIGSLKLENLWYVKINLGSGLANTIATYAFLALGFGILANLLCAVIGLIVKKTGVMDYIRSIALFAIAIVCFVMLAIDTKFVNIEDYLGTICSLALAAVQCFTVIIIGSVKKRKAKKQAEADAQASNFVFDENDQMAIKGYENVQAPASEPEADTASSALDDAAQISIDDITAAPVEDESAATETEAEITAEPVEEIVEEVQGERVEEQPFNFEQTQYDGQYNREYDEYAAKQAAEQAAAQQAAEQAAQQAAAQQAAAQQAAQQAAEQAAAQQAAQQAAAQQAAQQAAYQAAQQAAQQAAYQQAPYVSGQGYAQQYAQAYGMPYYNGAILPDAFINGLTPAEKDEFDKLFISRIYGENKRLPMYHVGGDNREFFAKVFVFIGRYRNIISDGLLEKIYTQSNLLK